MSFDGYLNFGGIELVNAQRTTAYINHLLPAMPFVRKTHLYDNLNLALGDPLYRTPVLDGADWVEKSPSAGEAGPLAQNFRNTTHEFYGLYPLSIEGIGDSTMQASVTEGILDGGFIGQERDASRSIRVRGLLLGESVAGVEAGLAWLRNALRRNACAMHGDQCGYSDLSYFLAEPEVCDPQWSIGFGDGEENALAGPLDPNNSPLNTPDGTFFESGRRVSWTWNLPPLDGVKVRFGGELNDGTTFDNRGPLYLRRSNYITNPKLENDLGGWSATGATMTRGIGETERFGSLYQSVSMTTRVNFAPDPSFENGDPESNGWRASGNITAEFDDTAPEGSHVAVVPARVGGNWLEFTALGGNTPADELTLSFWRRHPGPITITVTKPDGAIRDNPTLSNATDSWQRLSADILVVTGDVVRLSTDGANELRVDGFLFSPVSDPENTYFDGDSLSPTLKTAQYSVGGRTVTKTTVPGGWNLTQRTPMRLPVTPTRFRVVFSNRVDLTDEALAPVAAAVGIYIGERVGSTGAYAVTPHTIVDGTTNPGGIGSVGGSIATSDWVDAGDFEITAGVDYLLSAGIVLPSGGEVSVNPGPAYSGGNLLDGPNLAAPGAFNMGGSFYDMWIEYEVETSLPVLAIIGHSLNSPGNVNSGVHPWDGEYQSWSNVWAEAEGAIASTMSIPGSWLAHYGDASTKWDMLDGITPDRVAIWGASSDLAGGSGLATVQGRIVSVMAKAATLWPNAEFSVMTEPGRGLVGAVETDRIDYNAWLLSGALGPDVTIVDTDALLSSGNVLRPAIDADGSHFTTAGHAEVAELFAGVTHVPTLGEAGFVYEYVGGPTGYSRARNGVLSSVSVESSQTDSGTGASVFSVDLRSVEFSPTVLVELIDPDDVVIGSGLVNVGPTWQRFGLGLNAGSSLRVRLSGLGGFEWTRAMLENSAILNPYFDGDSPNTGGDDFNTYWVSMPNSSASRIDYVGSFTTVSDAGWRPYLYVDEGAISAVYYTSELTIEVPIEYQLRPYARTYHNVSCTRGPQKIREYSLDIGAATEVDFILTAGNPHAYTTTAEVVFDEFSGDTSIYSDYPRNLAVNPSPQEDSFGYMFSGVNVTAARVAAIGRDGDFGWRATWSADSAVVTNGAGYSAGGAFEINLLGEDIWLTAEAKPSATHTLAIRYAWFDAVGALLGAFQTDPNHFVVTGGQWATLTTGKLTPPANARQMAMRVVNPEAATDNWLTGQTLIVDHFGVLTAPVPWFDGASADTATAEYEWKGDPYDSESFMTSIPADLTSLVVDPDLPVVPAPPKPPTVPDIAIDESQIVWRRYYFDLSASDVPLWAATIPTIEFLTQATDVRQLRVRFHPNPFGWPAEDVDPTGYCGEFLLSYLPANSTLTVTGVSEQAWASVGGSAPVPANHLLYGTDGAPMEWPELSCNIPYVMTIDVPTTLDEDDIEFSLSINRRD